MRVLITGGTGSLGSRLAKKWYADGHQVSILSRNPQKQNLLSKEIPKAAFFLTDICNENEVYKACLGQDVLIHAAAIKQVANGEYHPAEYARVNVIGTQIVADAWTRARHENHLTLRPLEPRKALLISTDKAVSSLNTYGASKKISEAIFRKHNFSVIRYGNVVESDGSFLESWKRALENSTPIKVRRPFPTRFFLSFEQTIQIIEEVLDLMLSQQGIFVPNNLKSFSIEDVAIATELPIEYEDLLPYEKVHEVLVAEGEVAERLTDTISVIRPGWNNIGWGHFHSNTAPRIPADEFLRLVNWKSSQS